MAFKVLYCEFMKDDTLLKYTTRMDLSLSMKYGLKCMLLSFLIFTNPWHSPIRVMVANVGLNSFIIVENILI